MKDMDRNKQGENNRQVILGNDRYSVADTCSRVTAPQSDDVRSLTSSAILSKYSVNPSEVYNPKETDDKSSDATFTTTQYGLMYDVMHDQLQKEKIQRKRNNF